MPSMVFRPRRNGTPGGHSDYQTHRIAFLPDEQGLDRHEAASFPVDFYLRNTTFPMPSRDVLHMSITQTNTIHEKCMASVTLSFATYCQFSSLQPSPQSGRRYFYIRDISTPAC